MTDNTAEFQQHQGLPIITYLVDPRQSYHIQDRGDFLQGS